MRAHLKGRAGSSRDSLKSDTTPSFQFLAPLLDLVAQDHHKCTEHISQFRDFSKGLCPGLQAGWKT